MEAVGSSVQPRFLRLREKIPYVFRKRQMSVSWEVAEQFQGNWLRESFLSCLGASALGRSGKKSIYPSSSFKLWSLILPLQALGSKVSSFCISGTRERWSHIQSEGPFKQRGARSFINLVQSQSSQRKKNLRTWSSGSQINLAFRIAQYSRTLSRRRQVFHYL